MSELPTPENTHKKTPDVSPARGLGGTLSGDFAKHSSESASCGQAAYLARLEATTSTKRLDSYRLDGADDLTAWSRYLWNMAVSESLFPVLQTVEVNLRNAMHQAFLRAYQTEAWYDLQAFVLGPHEQERINDARTTLIKAKKELEPDRIVSELSFGFWVGLFDEHYENRGRGQVILWNRLLRKVFPYLPKEIPGNHRKFVHRRLIKIKQLRNRVFHHEQIIHWRDLEMQYGQILETVGWMSPEMKILVDRVSVFEEAYQGGVEPFRELLCNTLAKQGGTK